MNKKQIQKLIDQYDKKYTELKEKFGYDNIDVHYAKGKRDMLLDLHSKL